MKGKLIRRYIRYNKKQSFPLVVSVFLATSLLVGLLNIWMSFREMLVADVYQNKGRQHVWIKDSDGFTVDGNTIETVESFEKVKSFGVSSQIHEKSVRNINEVALRSEVLLRLTSMDEDAMNIKPPRIHSGRLPRNGGEVVLSRGIPLEKGYIYQDLPIESKFVLGGKEYVVVGFLDDFNAGADERVYSAITCSDDLGTDVAMYVEFDEEIRKNVNALARDLGIDESQVFDVGNFYTNRELITEEECAMVVNTDLLILLQEGPTSQVDRAMYFGILFLFVIVALFTGVLLVHIWGVTLNDRVRQMGLLQICGYTFGDVLAVLMGEGLTLSAVGMLAGTAFSDLLHRVAWGVIKGRRNIPLEGYQTGLHLDMVAVSLGVMLLLVVVSVLALARKIYNADLLDGIEDGGKHNEGRRAKEGRLFSGLPIDIRMSLRFLTRNKMRTASTIVSLSMASVAVIVFLTFWDAVNVQLVEGMEVPDSQYYVFANEITHMDELLEEMPYVDDVRIHYDLMLEVALDEEKWKEQKHLDTIPESNNGNRLIAAAGVGEAYYNDKLSMVQGEEMTYQEWEESGSCFIWDVYEDKNKEERMTTYAPGDVLEYFPRDDELGAFEGGSLPIAGIVNVKSQNQLDDRRFFDVLVPYKTFFERFDPSMEYLFVNAKPGYETQLGEWLDENRGYYGVTINDNVTEFLQTNDTKLTLKVGLSAILLIVMFLCVVNTANTMYANQRARKRENRILYYVGYSQWQFVSGMATEMVAYVLCAVVVGGLFATVVLERVTAYLIGAANVTIGVPVVYVLYNVWIMLAVGIVSMVLAIRRMDKVEIV